MTIERGAVFKTGIREYDKRAWVPGVGGNNECVGFKNWFLQRPHFLPCKVVLILQLINSANSSKAVRYSDRTAS